MKFTIYNNEHQKKIEQQFITILVGFITFSVFLGFYTHFVFRREPPAVQEPRHVALATQILRSAVLDLDANVREEALKASSQSHQLEFDEPLVLGKL